MYLQHFGLTDRPFRIVPSPRFFFVSDTHDEGRARILYGIRENRGFVVVTGGVGLGKTTVLLSVVNELESEMDVAIIVNPIDSFDQLLKMICEELGVSVRDADEASLLAHLNTTLLNSYAKGRGCVLLLDEAQNLSIEVLEKVRTLSNLQTEDASLLQIVLVGQPELTAKLNDHRLRQLRQRIGVWHEIQALTQEDTADYVWHRLALAGCPDPRAVVKRRTCGLIHDYSGGIPRLINQISDTALVVAYGQGRRSVDPDHVREAAAELRLEADESPRRSGEPDDPTPSRGRRRWLVAVLIGVVLVLLAGAAWTQFGPSFGFAGTAGVAQSSGDAVMAGLSSPASALPGPVEHLAEPAPAKLESARPVGPELLARYRQVEALRAGGLVYAVHLGSFRTLEEAREFSGQLVLDSSPWLMPLYVEETFDRPAWYRVTAGGYADRADAVARVRKMKSDLGLHYAQLTQLKPGARALLPSGLRGVEDAQANE